jgi:hypothetical protein
MFFVSVLYVKNFCKSACVLDGISLEVYKIPMERGGRVSSVGVVAKAGRSGVRFPGGTRDVMFSTTHRPAPGTIQPHIKWVPGVNRLGRGTDDSPPSSAEVRNEWSYTSPLPVSLYDVTVLRLPRQNM